MCMISVKDERMGKQVRHKIGRNGHRKECRCKKRVMDVRPGEYGVYLYNKRKRMYSGSCQWKKQPKWYLMKRKDG